MLATVARPVLYVANGLGLLRSKFDAQIIGA